MRSYLIDGALKSHTTLHGVTMWEAHARVWDPRDDIREVVAWAVPCGVAAVNGVHMTEKEIGIKWPDVSTIGGQGALLHVAKCLAVQEWERRFGGVK